MEGYQYQPFPYAFDPPPISNKDIYAANSNLEDDEESSDESSSYESNSGKLIEQNNLIYQNIPFGNSGNHNPIFPPPINNSNNSSIPPHPGFPPQINYGYSGNPPPLILPPQNSEGLNPNISHENFSANINTASKNYSIPPNNTSNNNSSMPPSYIPNHYPSLSPKDLQPSDNIEYKNSTIPPISYLPKTDPNKNIINPPNNSESYNPNYPPKIIKNPNTSIAPPPSSSFNYSNAPPSIPSNNSSIPPQFHNQPPNAANLNPIKQPDLGAQNFKNMINPSMSNQSYLNSNPVPLNYNPVEVNQSINPYFGSNQNLKLSQLDSKKFYPNFDEENISDSSDSVKIKPSIHNNPNPKENNFYASVNPPNPFPSDSKPNNSESYNPNYPPKIIKNPNTSIAPPPSSSFNYSNVPPSIPYNNSSIPPQFHNQPPNAANLNPIKQPDLGAQNFKNMINPSMSNQSYFNSNPVPFYYKPVEVNQSINPFIGSNQNLKLSQLDSGKFYANNDEENISDSSDSVKIKPSMHNNPDPKENNFYASVNQPNPNPSDSAANSKIINQLPNAPKASINQNTKENEVAPKTSKIIINKDGAGTRRNQEENEIILQGNLYSNYNEYSTKFLSDFKNFIIIKTKCEKLCCIRETNLFRLQKLKTCFGGDCEQNLITFIINNYAGLNRDQILKYSVVDLYLICSLIEINELTVFIQNNTSILDWVKRTSDESIRIIKLKKINDEQVPIKFFEKTRLVLIRSIETNGKNLNEITAHELAKSFDS